MMTQKHSRFSAKSAAVLTLIAKGHTYQQILEQHPDLTYPDIFCAAQEALDIIKAGSSSYQEKLAGIRKVYPRAYEKWTMEEDTSLVELVCADLGVDEIASRMQRQPSAVRSRLQKMGYSPKK